MAEKPMTHRQDESLFDRPREAQSRGEAQSAEPRAFKGLVQSCLAHRFIKVRVIFI